MGLHTHVYFLACLLRRCRNNDTSVARTISRSWFQIPFSHKRRPRPLEKWLILGVEQGTGKRRLERLVVPESKDVLKERSDGETPKGHRSQL